MRKFKKITTIPELVNIYQNLKILDNYYPDFEDWYYNKIIPNILQSNGTALALFEKNDIVGISIFKENKLQALRIFENFQNTGKGIYLIDETLKQMNNEKPFCTVSEEMIHEYSRIFINRYNFNVDRVEKNMYRKGKLEYIFNNDNFSKSKTEYGV